MHNLYVLQVNQIDISPDGKIVVAAGYQQLRLYDIASPSPYPSATYEKFEKNVTAIGFQKLNQWIFTGGEDGQLCIWDLRTATCQRKLKVPSAVNTAVLHPDQTSLIMGQDNMTCSIWDLRQDQEQVIFKNNRKDCSFQSVSINQVASHICALDNKGVLRIWKINSYDKPLITKQCHVTRGLKTAFSPDCSQIVTTSADKTAVLWKFEETDITKEHILFTPEQKWVWDACFSADSLFLFTGSSDGTVRLWDTRIPDKPSNSKLPEGHSRLLKKEYAAHQKAVVSICFWDKESRTA